MVQMDVVVVVDCMCAVHLFAMAGLTHLCQNVGQFFTLSLATNVCAQTSLAEFQCTLILGNLQQFHASLLIWSMSNHFTHQIAYEFCVLCLDLLSKQKKGRVEKKWEPLIWVGNEKIGFGFGRYIECVFECVSVIQSLQLNQKANDGPQRMRMHQKNIGTSHNNAGSWFCLSLNGLVLLSSFKETPSRIHLEWNFRNNYTLGWGYACT